MCVCVHVCKYRCPGSPELSDHSGAGVINGCELPDVDTVDLNPVLLNKQCLLLTEPSSLTHVDF